MHRFVPWALVALCFALGVASRAVLDCFTVFVPALEHEFSASRSAITLVYSFGLMSSMAAPLAGLIADRLGLRTLSLIGIGAAAAGTAAASFATEIWQLYLGIGLLLGFGGVAVGAVPSSIIVSRWFPAQRMGVPMAVAWSSAGVGVMLLLPIAQRLIADDGWRHAYRVAAVFSAAFLPLLLVLPWRRIEAGITGAARARTSGGAGPTVAQALRDWPFWALAASFALTSLGIFAIFPQSMVYLLERGLDGGYAARALAVAGVLTPLGMVGFSWLADRGGRKLAAIMAYLCSIGGVGALALVRGPEDTVFLWLYVLLFGGSMGSRGPMISALATMRYRGAQFGRIYGLISIGTGVGGFLGAWIGGLLHDLTDGYAWVMVFAACSLAVACTTLGAEAGARERLSR
ncbi:MAG: MFS transporter [Reyranellaceae bacterium]